MPSLINIYNMSLGELAADLIGDPQQLTGNAPFLAAQYPTVRDAVLRAHPWNCAISRQYLPGAAAQGPSELAYEYPLPTNPFCLRALNLIQLPRVKWIVEGRRLFCDQAGPLPLRFIGRVTTEENFDALLVTALAKRLASVCAYKVTRKSRGLDLFKEYKEVLAEARAVDGQEGWPDEDEPFESELLAAREE